MSEAKPEIIVSSEDLTPEMVAGLDDQAKADLVSYFIALSIKIREGIEVETVKNPTRTSEELRSQIELFSSLERVSGFLSKLAGEEEGRVYAAQHRMYQVRREELEDRLSNLENPSSVRYGPELASVSAAIRARMSHQYTAPVAETHEAQVA